jgi:negative regulator of sigma-B (phosphoserine phosphatase)
MVGVSMIAQEQHLAGGDSQLAPPIEWGVAGRSFDGGPESGDQHLVELFPNGVLVAVIDGLGHGPRAATAGETAVMALKGHGHEPVAPLLKRCHEMLRRTRGVVMSMASFNALDDTMTWLGVGNVKGLLLFAGGSGGASRERLLLRGGVVGYNLPTLRPASVPVSHGDTLIFATDGLRSVFAEELTLGEAPQQMADHILSQYRRGTDDAMVLVARYVGADKDSRMDKSRKAK